MTLEVRLARLLDRVAFLRSCRTLDRTHREARSAALITRSAKPTLTWCVSRIQRFR